MKKWFNCLLALLLVFAAACGGGGSGDDTSDAADKPRASASDNDSQNSSGEEDDSNSDTNSDAEKGSLSGHWTRTNTDCEEEDVGGTLVFDGTTHSTDGFDSLVEIYHGTPDTPSEFTAIHDVRYNVEQNFLGDCAFPDLVDFEDDECLAWCFGQASADLSHLSITCDEDLELGTTCTIEYEFDE